MPELPEVETVMRGLEKVLLHQTIERIETTRGNLRIPFPKNLKSVTDSKITSFERRAKYILMHLSNGSTMIIHLGMSGRMTVDPVSRQKHDHLIIDTNGKKKKHTVVFNDPRRFGLVDLCATDKIAKHRFFTHLGPEPLLDIFDAEYLLQKLSNKKIALKIAIMDQQVVVGVGNIYAAEALFMSGIHPARAAGSLKKAEAEKLVAAIKTVLDSAIRAGGSSLRDYVQADGELGYFQHAFKVYDCEGEACRTCKNNKSTIQRITQGGRSTFFCPVCQPLSRGKA